MTGIDTAASELVLTGDERLQFDKLLLTTGATPRRPAIPGADVDGIHYLRDLSHADVLRKRLAAGGSVVVVGAGWIGAEVAASARQEGLDVTVVETTSLERVMGHQVGAVYRDLHLDHGVRFVLGAGVDAFQGSGTVEAVRISDGEVIGCDMVGMGRHRCLADADPLARTVGPCAARRPQ